MNGDTDIGWYALFVKTQCEQEVCNAIEKLLPKPSCPSSDLNVFRYRLLAPRKALSFRNRKDGAALRRNTGTEALFPGYLFVQTADIGSIERVLRLNDHFYKVLRNDAFDGRSVSDREIRQILGMLDGGDVVEGSVVFLEGDRVFVLSGPLARYEGVVTRVDKRRRKALVNLNLGGAVFPTEVECRVLDKLKGDVMSVLPLAKSVERNKFGIDRGNAEI